ncbi:trypsin-1-like [Culicoides brevitarsis]|uniref:trypsin-1-like n=1 Tax=Culicoides brevitarsis TaxID=469753 RepID=UPI00307BADA7
MKGQAFVLLSIFFFVGVDSFKVLGRFNPRYAFNERIVGGEAVDVKDHPHQVSLQSSWHFCGGSLISKDYVLTAAHCAQGQNPANLKVRVGSSFNAKGGELVQVQSLLVHPQYDSNTIDYDFALLKLNKSLEFSETVQPVKLTEQDKSPAAGTLCTVSGWGNTQNPNESSDKLRAVSVPVVDQEECAQKYNEFYGVTPRMLCAGLEEGGKDSCQGDSGGPLTSNGVLVGVVSWGKGCALKNFPGVYARVAAVRNWVRENSGV